MNDRVRVRIFDDNHYVIKNLNKRNINIYNIEYSKSGCIYTIDANELDSIPFKTEVLSYKGIKGYLVKIKHNIHFIFAVLISIVLIILISNVVVKVEVIHNDKFIREIILEELDKYGVHPLIFKKRFISLQKIKEQIKKDYPEDIEWLEIVDNGMKYTIRVEERLITKKKEQKKYCDIISTKDAMIISSKVSSGQIIVDPNDYVKKESILISGAVKFNEETKTYTCANGVVYGNTWYTVNVSMPYNYIKKDYTGKSKYNIAFEYGSKRISLFKVHFDKYETKRKKIFSIGKFTLYKEKNIEYTSKQKKYTDEEVVKKSLAAGREKILLNLDNNASILSEKVLQTNYFDSIMEMDIFYSIKEIISSEVEREIPVEEKGQEHEVTE